MIDLYLRSILVGVLIAAVAIGVALITTTLLVNADNKRNKKKPNEYRDYLVRRLKGE